VAAALVGLACAQARAETELSFYTGAQTAPHSTVRVRDHVDLGTVSFGAGWEGRSFEAPPYWGARYTRWLGEGTGWGFGAEITHTKVYADDDTLSLSGFDRLEMTDGLNILTFNAMYRWKDPSRRLVPYVGAGIGLAIPHVDTQTANDRTFGYQITGPALRATAGASLPLNDRWSVFGEYQGTISQNTADFDEGGQMKTRIITNAVNLGLSFRF
jgi:lipid A oxidase